MTRSRILTQGLVLAGLVAMVYPSKAVATCGTGNAPSYDDITAVSFQREKGFWTARKGYRAKSFDGSAFGVLFWDLEPTKYSQEDLAGQIGTYRLRASLKDVVSILRRGGFFALSPPDLLVTDVQRDVLSVRRCAVVTKLTLPDNGDDPIVDRPTRKLFDDVVALIIASPKTKIADQPEEFYFNGFDP